MKKSEIHVRVPEPLARQVRFILQNPVTGKVQKGALGQLIEDLLTQWVRLKALDLSDLETEKDD